MSKILRLLSKWHNPRLTSIVIYSLFVCLGLIMYCFRDYWTEPFKVFQIAMELICMAILVVFYRLHFNKVKNGTYSERYFVGLCNLLYLCLFIDVVARSIDGCLEFSGLSTFANGAVYILEFAHGILFCEYIFTSIDNKSRSLMKIIRIVRIIYTIAFMVRVLMVISGSFYSLDGEGNVTYGSMWFLSFLFIPILVLFVCGVAGGANIKSNKLVSILSYPLSGMVMIVIAVIDRNYANPLVTLSLSIMLIYISSFAETNQANIKLNETFQTYISEDVLESPDKLASFADTCRATLLFCNLHNFSVDMETMEPEDAVVVLNNYFSKMTVLIEQNNGKLLDLPGYGIFAIFTSGEHANDALNAANAIVDKLEEVNTYNKSNHYPLFKIGIGINTGDVILGNIGSHNHMRYSAIGKNVNLASRASSYAKDGMIALTESTLEACNKKPDVVFAGAFTPKGVNKQIKIYTFNR